MKFYLAIVMLVLYPIFLRIDQAHKIKAARDGEHSVLASWDKNPEPDVHHYMIYRGTSSREYSPVAQVNHPDTSIIIDGMAAGVTYFFAVTAIDTADNESAYSDEVQFSFGETTGYDFNDDGIVDVLDWIFLLRHIGMNSDGPDYRPEMDLNSDGWIDGIDKAIFARLSEFI